MKKHILFFLMAITSLPIFAQSIIVTTVGTQYQCCQEVGTPYNAIYYDSLDLNQDNQIDIRYFSMSNMLTGEIGFYVQSYNGFQFTDPINFGQSFEGVLNGWYTGAGNVLIVNPLFSTPWLDTLKYTGVRKINATDTLYGWIKLKYGKTNTTPTLDTLQIIDFAWNTIANEHILAGQIFPTSVSTTKNLLGISIYPNPFSNMLKVNLSEYEKNIRCQIYDVQGRKVFEYELNDLSNQLQLNKLTSGIYYIKIQKDNFWEVEKIICSQ